MFIEHISVSRKKTFDECPQRYKYHYHLKMPSPGPEPFYFTYGSFIHKIAEIYVKDKAKQTLGQIAKEILKGKIELEPGRVCPPLPDEYKAKMQRHLRAIQTLTKRIGMDGLVEYKFDYDLDPPNQKTVTGFIDRLIIKKKKAFIIDYKTTKKGKFRATKETVKGDLQLRTYCRIVQKKFKIKASNIKAALFYLEDQELIACQYSEQSLDNVEQDLRDAYFKIEQANADQVRGNVGFHCEYCAYKGICPFYRAQNTNISWDGDFKSLGW